MDEQICKCFLTEFDTPAEYIAVLIGFAWDTQGTNIFAYNVVKGMYDELIALHPDTPAQLLNDITTWENAPKVRRLMRKVGIGRDEFLDFLQSSR